MQRTARTPPRARNAAPEERRDAGCPAHPATPRCFFPCIHLLMLLRCTQSGDRVLSCVCAAEGLEGCSWLGQGDAVSFHCVCPKGLCRMQRSSRASRALSLLSSRLLCPDTAVGSSWVHRSHRSSPRHQQYINALSFRDNPKPPFSCPGAKRCTSQTTQTHLCAYR